MTANALLLWMSARRRGSWQQFRAAVEELHIGDGHDALADDDSSGEESGLPLYQALRLNLQTLAHAEFFAGADGAEWRITPPTLAVTQVSSGWLGVLAGARSLKLMDRVRTAGTSIELETIQSSNCPDQILALATSDQRLAEFAKHAGVQLQLDAPAALLASLPTIDDPMIRNQFPLPFGAEWRIDRFSVRELRWQRSTRNEAEATFGGLFRFTLRYQRYFIYCSSGSAFRLPGQVGKFLALKRGRRNVLRYSVKDQQLSVPAALRPPFLIERALVLCSGSLPAYRVASDGGTLDYLNIPTRIANTAAALLCQDFR